MSKLTFLMYFLDFSAFEMQNALLHSLNLYIYIYNDTNTLSCVDLYSSVYV